MTILTYILVGLAVGLISGTLGIGGGVLLVPLLMVLLHFDQSKATGTTLAVLVPPVGLLAALKYYTEGLIDVEAAVWIAASFAGGAYLGAAVVPLLPTAALRLAFGLMLVYIGFRFILAFDAEAASAAGGLAGCALAWLAFVGLRALGRRHLAAPNLGEQIRASRQQRHDDIDYHI
jgi:uncharacterized membrane protein YfcA